MHRKEVTQNATPHFEQLVQQTSEIAAKLAASNAGRRLMNRALACNGKNRFRCPLSIPPLRFGRFDWLRWTPQSQSVGEDF